MSLLLYYSVLLLFTTINSNDPNSIPTVQPLENKSTEFYVFFNATHCEVGMNRTKIQTPNFAVKNLLQPKDCNPDYGRNIQINIHEAELYYITSKWEEQLKNSAEKNKYRRTCKVLDDKKIIDTCFITLTFNSVKKHVNASMQGMDPNWNTSRRSTDTSAPNELFIYIGAGVGAVLLIVAIQTVCIVSYSRKAAKTRRALENIMQLREERRDANERYSHEPVSKKTSPKEEEDVLYESLEHLTVPAAKGDGGTIKSVDIKNRPPLPLPHEMTLGREGWGSLRKKDGMRPPMPLPHELSLSGYNVRTLPHKSVTQKEFFERLPEQQMSGTLKMRPKPNPMQSVPLNTLFQSNMSLHGSRERLPEPPMTPPRFGSNAQLNIPVNTKLQRNMSFKGSRERFPDPPTNPNIPPRFGPNTLSKNASPSPIAGKPLCKYPVAGMQTRNGLQPETRGFQDTRDRVPESPVNASSSSLRAGPNALPKSVTPSPALGKPPRFPANPSPLRNAAHDNRERFPEQQVSNSTPFRVPHVVPKVQASNNMVSELSKVFSKINPQPPMEDQRNSSDEEWTYEMLPPTKKYLH